MQEKAKRNIAIISTSYWDSPLRFRRHFFAEIAASLGHRVLYVNPIFTIFSFVQDKDSRKCFFHFLKGNVKINPYLSTFTTPPLLPFQQKFHFIKCLNISISKYFIARAKNRYFANEEVVEIVYLPEDALRLTKSKVLVYDCVDDHAEYPWNKGKEDSILQLEKELALRANVLSVSSSFLLGKKKHLNSNNILIPNGVNFKLFNKAITDSNRPSDLPNAQGSTILYVGAIHEWFDELLVEKIANHNENWNIVLIGPTNKRLTAKMFNSSNISYLGTKSQSDLPQYINYADVCIIPFILNDLVKGVNPLKLYEYLSVGKPVVSTNLPDVAKIQRLNSIHIGLDHDQFIEQLEKLIPQNDESTIRERVAVAKKYSWENIFHELMVKIEREFE